MTTNNEKAITTAYRAIKERKKIVLLTGAGVSVESGIPDFQTTDENWEDELQRGEAISLGRFLDEPKEFWKSWRNIHKGGYKPNNFHVLMSELSATTSLQIFTQNTDRLHGDRAVEMHGNSKQVICMNRDCENFAKPKPLPMIPLAPTCSKCQKVLKPNTSLFGEGITGFSVAQNAIVEADLLIVAGTSLTIGPVSDLPLHLHHMGSPGIAMWVNTENRPPEGYQFDRKYIGSAVSFANDLEAKLGHGTSSIGTT